ncbi:MAG: PaaI family thioesterase [Verrucomicrobia bacterium]|nr:PaaI family thioesterase [Verrucomicrobiota bacterium]
MSTDKESTGPIHPLRNGTLPWTRSCFVCGESNPHGLQLKSRVEAARVVIDYTPRDEDRGWATLMHGGVATTLLDEVMTWAAILQSRQACVAAELNVRLKRPIVVGNPLRIAGEVSGGQSRLMLTRGTITDASGTVLYEATGKFMPMDGDAARLCADDFAPSPGAIPLAQLLG